jgi:hypothetical protein
MPILIPILTALIPALIKEGESLLGSPPPSDHVWISELVDEIVSDLEAHLPAWIRPAAPELETFLSELIEKEIAKL